MTDTLAKPRLALELDSIAQWRKEQAGAFDEQLVELAGKEQALREQIAELQRELQENSEQQGSVKTELEALPAQETAKAHAALLELLAQDRALVEARAAALQELRDLAVVKLQERLDEPEIAASIEEYEKFRDVEPVLGSLPPSYRQVVMDHHEALKEKLEPLFELAKGPTEPLDLDPAAVSLVASVDVEADKPTAFALFLPVGFQVYRSWADRPEDLSAQLAYRVIAALSQALDRLGAPDAPVVYQDFHGSLSIQVWLDDHDLDADVRETMDALLGKQLAGAVESRMVRLGFEVSWVDPAVIGPEEEDTAEGEPGEEAPEGAPSADDSKKFKPVQIVLRRGGSDHW